MTKAAIFPGSPFVDIIFIIRVLSSKLIHDEERAPPLDTARFLQWYKSKGITVN
jgi:hypothetical protein